MHRPSMERSGQQRQRRALLMVAVAFLAQNVGVSMGFGAYGAMVGAIEQQFHTSRALASSGLSAMAVMIGLCAPAVGSLIARWGTRQVMLAGAGLCVAGYAVLTQVSDIRVLLGVYLVLIGPGACLLGTVPGCTLAASWVEPGARGRALGIVNMSLFICFFPPIAARVLAAYGLHAVFLMLGVLTLAITPLLLLVADCPATDADASAGAHGHGVVTGAAEPAEGVLLRPAFLAVVFGSSCLVATGMVMVSHLVSLGSDRGLDLTHASLLLSAFGIACAVGAGLFGWFADLTSVRIAFIVAALLPIPGVAVLIHGSAFVTLFGSAALVGLCSGAVVGLQSTALIAWLGERVFSRAIGLLYLLQVPVLLGAAPIAGFLYDRAGSYTPAFAALIVILLCAGAVLMLPRRLAVAPMLVPTA